MTLWIHISRIIFPGRVTMSTFTNGPHPISQFIVSLSRTYPSRNDDYSDHDELKGLRRCATSFIFHRSKISKWLPFHARNEKFIFPSLNLKKKNQIIFWNYCHNIDFIHDVLYCIIRNLIKSSHCKIAMV